MPETRHITIAGLLKFREFVATLDARERDFGIAESDSMCRWLEDNEYDIVDVIRLIDVLNTGRDDVRVLSIPDTADGIRQYFWCVLRWIDVRNSRSPYSDEYESRKRTIERTLEADRAVN